MYVNVSLDILEMDKTAEVNLISSLHDTFDYYAAPFSCVARQFDNLLLITRDDLGNRFSC